MWCFWWTLICVCVQRGDNFTILCCVKHSGPGDVKVPPRLSLCCNNNTETQSFDSWKGLLLPAVHPIYTHTHSTGLQMTAAGWVSACIIYRERSIHASNDISLGRTTRGLVVMTHAAAPRSKNNSAHKSRSSSPQLFKMKTIMWVLLSSKQNKNGLCDNEPP